MLHYWNRLRGDKPMPEIQHLNTSVIEDLWPNCFRIGIKGSLYKFDYMGAPIIAICGQDMTGREINTQVKHFPSTLTKELPDVIKTQSAIEGEGHFLTSDGKMVKYRSCFLPFGNEKRGVTDVVVGLSYRMFI